MQSGSRSAGLAVAGSGHGTHSAGDRTEAVVDSELAAVEAAIADAIRRPHPPLARAKASGHEDVREASEATDAGPNADPTPEDGVGQPDGAEVTALTAVRALNDRQQGRLWRDIRERPNFWESLNEIEPGVVARLSALAERLRWEVIFITQRPPTAGDTCQLQTHRWLERHGYSRPNVFVLRGPRGRVAKALDLDVVIDDRPENTLDVLAASSARPVLIWRGEEASPVPENARRMGIQVFKSMTACLDALAKPSWGKPTLLGRIMGLFRGGGAGTGDRDRGTRTESL
jgi:hypothetical protein